MNENKNIPKLMALNESGVKEESYSYNSLHLKNKKDLISTT